MTFTVGHVEGGTNAGWRRLKERPAPHGWFCNCEGPDGMILRRSYLVKCTDCGAERPKG